MQREQLDAQFVDFDIQPVHFMITLDDDVGEIGIPVDQRFDRFLDLILDQAAHVKNFFTQFGQLFFVFLICVLCRHGLLRDHPKRPVM